jgi:hypothetical protein
MHNEIPTLFRTVALLLTAVAALSGCGDRGMFSKGMRREARTGSLGSAIDSTKVTVSYLSSLCGADGVKSCPKGTAPEVEIHIEDRSVVLDFSNVAEPGAFADVDFEGFLLEISADANTSIHEAEVDRDVTNLDIASEAVTGEDVYLEVNLAGLAYDSDSLIKIDLLANPLNFLGQGE